MGTLKAVDSIIEMISLIEIVCKKIIALIEISLFSHFVAIDDI